MRDCLKAIRRFGNKTSANIVLPTLIAQAEGVATKVFGNNFKKSIKSINSDDKFLFTSGEFFVNILFLYTNGIAIEKIKNPELSRNKILHGEYLKYGNIASVIKLFFILDYLYKIEEEKQIP